MTEPVFIITMTLEMPAMKMRNPRNPTIVEAPAMITRMEPLTIARAINPTMILATMSLFNVLPFVWGGLFSLADNSILQTVWR